MASTIWSRDEVASEPCPLNGRRSSKEVWVKLFVIHLTTIAAFCHVVSLRHQRIRSWRLIAYLLYPSTILVTHALAIAMLAGAVIYWILFDRTRRFGKSLVRAPRFLLASAPVPEPSDEPQESEPILKIAGRVLLACAFLTQCSGTLALFERRVNHDAVTWSDIRVFEVAVTGALISLYWIFISARVPIFVQPVPATPPEDATLLDLFIMNLRGCNIDTSATYAVLEYNWINHALGFFGNYYLCVLTLIIKCVYVFDCPLPQTAPVSNKTAIWMDYFMPQPVNFICWLSGFFFLFIYIPIKDEDNPERRPPREFVFLRWLFIFITLLKIDLEVVLFRLGTEWFHIYEQLKKLEPSPVNQTCPLLWSDPASNWIWALG